MAELPCFVYDQLPAGYIRLLTPTSSSSEDGQSWSLQTVSLDQPDLVYEALSYAWGSQAHLFPITLNGCVLYVHGNLHSALPYLAGRGKTRPVLPIWIDAICINQAHHKEKMIQIREMHRIYRYAAKVWVWLGIPEHPERILEAMDVFDVTSVKRTRALDLDCIDMPLMSAIRYLLMNDWFRRLWVVQEAALAQDISFLSGDVELQWSDMENAMSCTENGAIFHTRKWTQWYWNSDEVHGVSPASILMNIAALIAPTQECSRPEDRVLALLGLVNQGDLRGSALDINIAYTSYQDLFTRFSGCILIEHPNPDGIEWWGWLSMAFRPGKCDGLPSWVPDLHNIGKTTYSIGNLEFRIPTYFIGNLESRIPSYQAAMGRKNEPRGNLQIGQLMLRGRILDEVVMVFEPSPIDSGLHLGGSPARRNKTLIAVAEWEEKLAYDVMHSTTFETRREGCVGLNRDITLDTYWRTLIGNRVSVHDKVVMRDWYDDFQATGRSLRETDTAHETER